MCGVVWCSTQTARPPVPICIKSRVPDGPVCVWRGSRDRKWITPVVSTGRSIVWPQIAPFESLMTRCGRYSSHICLCIIHNSSKTINRFSQLSLKLIDVHLIFSSFLLFERESAQPTNPESSFLWCDLRGSPQKCLIALFVCRGKHHHLETYSFDELFQHQHSTLVISFCSGQTLIETILLECGHSQMMTSLCGQI